MLFEKKKLFYSLLDFTVHSALKRSKYLLNLGGSTANKSTLKPTGLPRDCLKITCIYHTCTLIH